MQKSKEFRKLIDNAIEGDANAQYILGATYFTGDFEGAANPVEVDTEAGIYWYCQSAKQGFVEAKYNMGVIIALGTDGFIKDEKLGMRLITESAEANESCACRFLSISYEFGYNGKKIDPELAEYWSKRAFEEEEIYNQPVDIERELGIKLSVPSMVKKVEK